MNFLMQIITLIVFIFIASCTKTQEEHFGPGHPLRLDRLEAEMDLVVTPVEVQCTNKEKEDAKAIHAAIVEAMKRPYHFVDFSHSKFPCKGSLDLEPDSVDAHDIMFFGGMFD